MKQISEQTILITRSTDGIGKAAAIKIARQNATVLIHGRNKDKTALVLKQIKDLSGNKKIDFFVADFASLAEVRKFGSEVLQRYPKLDVLINNAGAGFADERYSKDGYELRFAVNYLAPFLLTNLLLPALKKAAPSRIVNVSSAGQHPLNFQDIMLEKNFDSSIAYWQSKLAIIMFTIDLGAQLKQDRVTVNSLHPGTYLNTNMVRKAGISPLGDVESGADAILNLAISESLEGITGKYFNVKQEAKADPQAYNINSRKKLRDLSINLTNLKAV